MPIEPIPVTELTPAAAALAAKSDKKNASQLGKEDFLKLLIAQLKNQDPSNAQDMESMTQQMTQFSMLEQLTNLAASTETSNVSLARTHAVELLGNTVTYKDRDGSLKEGVVEHVDTTAAAPRLTIGGNAGLLLADVVGVKS
ncbi:MAG TPA: flagellar hook capping FlgD N-terminal domain-containing protein [Solirubrobacteraceae bacterium]|nr:flagellar hook capping FlgD N-terminal domain-containing protein [Solirubrobacteraceae bacterium]